MSRGDVSATGILNAVAPRLRHAGPAAIAVLLVTALPFRLLEAHFIDLLLRLRGEAARYGNLLIAVSALTVAAFLVSLYGRAVFIRACQHPPESWRHLLRVDARSLLTYVYIALAIQLAEVIFSPAIITIPIAVMLSGVAAAASTDRPRPGILKPFGQLGPYLQPGRVLVGLMSVFGIAFLVIMINLFFLAEVLVWAAGALPDFDSLKWGIAMEGSSRARLAVIVVSIMIIEPFFLAAMHVFADRVRSRHNGEDLLRRFRGLTAQRRIAAAFVALLMIGGTAYSQDRTASVEDYVQRLRDVRDALAESRFADAQRQSVFEYPIAAGGVRFEPDRALLRDARAAASESRIDSVVLARLAATISALETGAIDIPSRTADPRLLQQIRDREKAGELKAGGELAPVPEVSPSVADEIGRMFTGMIEWLAVRLEKLFDWLRKLWPRKGEKGEEGPAFLGVSVVVWIVTLFIVGVLLLLATYVLRRSRRRSALVESIPVASSERDADPLSRESNEWEKYAAELAASGRLREAIRAWYHAVLVTLYRSGMLHFRKGATNWEYVSAIAPTVAWRPRFITLTRTFDREWYGRYDTTADALDAHSSDARAILQTLRGTSR